MPEDNDPDLQRAIALSLAAQQSQSSREVIVISDDEDEDPKQVSARSIKDANKGLPAEQAAPKSAASFLSDRAKMEQERLARLKRLRPDSDTVPAQPVPKRHNSGANFQAATSRSARSTGRGAPNAGSSTNSDYFWDAEIRQTPCLGAEPRQDKLPTFRLSQVIGDRSDIALAIISAYCYDTTFTTERFNPGTPVILVIPSSNGESQMHHMLPNWIRTSPAMNTRGAMHIKFFIIAYKSGRLRIIITTANLIAYDYRDIENTIWVQDLPPLNSASSTPAPSASRLDEPFCVSLQRTLRALNVQPALNLMLREHPRLPLKSIDDLSRWDWSKVKARLIPSLAGKHTGWHEVLKNGHPRLMAALRSLGLRAGKGREVVIECQGSSIGRYSTQWINQFYHSALGESAEDYLDYSKAKRNKLPYPRGVKILFPSLTTVENSLRGYSGGGTMFCNRQTWSAANFPRDRFYDSNSKGGAVLMHSKMIIGTYRKSTKSKKNLDDSEDEDDGQIEVVGDSEAIGWAYIGSHNFTQAAWGNLDGSAFNPILTVTNMELGILMPLRSEEELQRIACFKRPARKYTASDVPWFQTEYLKE